MKKSFLLFLFISCITLFIGCKNFMNGSEILNELTDVIEYTNAKEISVRVQLAQGSRGTVFPSGDIKQKLGYKFEISYESDGTCYFNKWTAEDESGQEFDSEFVEIEENEKAKTNVTVKTEQKVIIKANTLDNPSSKVTLSCDFGTGVLSTTQPQEIDIGDNLEIEFTEADNYQFVKWDVSGDCVSVKNIYAKSTKVKSEKDGTVVIKAICAERPAVVSASTKNVTGTVCKNTSTNITFNYPLAADTDLTKIKVYIGDLQTGFGENKPFLNPQFGNDKKTVIIPANQNSDYYIDVENGTTKQVTVLIPSDFYYVLDDATEEREATKVSVGGEGISWTYEINDKTNENTNITVNPSTSLGTLTSGVSGEYSIGKEVVFKYTVNENAQFIKWNVAAADGTVSFKENQDGNVQSLIIKTLKQGDVSIATEVYECPAFIENTILPANVNAGECLDSNFRVTFNQKIDKTAIEDAAIISVDGLALGGKDSENKYFTPLFNTDSKTFTFEVSEESSKIIELRELISIDTGKTKTLTVKIPAQAIFYKTNSGEKIIAKNDLNYSYRIKDETSKKANVKFVFTNGTLKLNEAAVNTGTTFAYSLGDKISLNYEISGGYKFEGWEAVDASSKTVENILQIEDSSEPETFVNVLNEIENAVITAKTNQRPVVTSFEPVNVSAGIPEDSQIQIKFSMPMDASTFDYDIFVDDSKTDETPSALSFKEEYFTKPIYTDGNKTVTIKVAAGKLINMTGYPLREVKIELKATVKSETGVTLAPDDLIHTYKINASKDASEPRFDSIEIKRGWDNGTITDKVYTAWEDADYKSNHAASLRIVCKGADAGQGLQKIELKQKLIKKVDGTEVNKDLPSIFAEGFTLDEGTLDQYTFDKVVNFDSEEIDGLVQVELYIYDGNGNKVKASDKCWYFIKDTKVEITGIYDCFNSRMALINVEEWNKEEFENNLNQLFNTWLFDLMYLGDDYWWYESGKEHTTSKDELKLKVYWGKEDSILTSVNGTTINICGDEYTSFVIDETDKDVERIVKLVITDEAGATAEIVKIMPPALTPQQIVAIYDKNNDNYSLMLPSFQDEQNKKYTYRYFYDEDDKWYSNINGGSKTFTPDSNIFTVDVKKKIFISVCSPDSVYGNVYSSIDLSKVEDLSAQSSLDVPQISNITITSGGSNSDYYNVDVNINKEDGVFYSYFIYWLDSSDNKRIVATSTENPFKVSFEPDELYKEMFISVAANDEKKIVESDGVKVEFKEKNKPLYIDQYESNVKSFYINEDYLSDYKFNTQIFSFNYGTHKDKEFTCYYMNYNNNWDGKIDVLTEKEIKKLDSFSWKQTFSLDYLAPIIPCNGLPDGDYLMCVYVEDDEPIPNYYCGPIGIEHVETLPEISNVAYTVVNEDIEITFDTKEEISQTTVKAYIYKLGDGNKWIQGTSGNNSYETLNHNTKNCNVTLYDGVSNDNKQFIKVWNYSYNTSEDYHSTSFFNGEYWSTSSKYTNEALSVPVYLYINLNDSNAKIPATNFSYAIDNNSQITVICSEDNPVLVHTLSVSDKFNYGTSVDDWERRGIEVHNEVYKNNANYIIDDSEVPSKSNYVVVAHFADGSTFISSVHHKD